MSSQSSGALLRACLRHKLELAAPASFVGRVRQRQHRHAATLTNLSTFAQSRHTRSEHKSPRSGLFSCPTATFPTASALHFSSVQNKRKDAKNPQTLLNNVKTVMKFSHKVTYEDRGTGAGKSLFHAHSKITLPASLNLPLTPQHTPDKGITVSSDGDVEIVTVGSGRSKKSAKKSAVVKAIDVLLHHCGIDVKVPPSQVLKQTTTMTTTTSNRHQHQKQTTTTTTSNRHQHQQQSPKKSKKDEAQDRKRRLAQAQMILELVHASRPSFDVQPKTKTQKWTATASTFVRGNCVSVTGSPGRSKADAEANALIELTQSSQFLDLIGQETMNEYHKLIQNSPAQQVAALWIRPLPDNVHEDLLEVLGTPEVHARRMERHALNKEEYEFHRKERQADPLKMQAQNRRKLASSEQLNSINMALLSKEDAKKEKIMNKPDGKQAQLNAIREALPIAKIRQDLLDALQTQQVVVVSAGTGSGKSTQCPQYILEQAIRDRKGAETQIIVTQPRRIAAISVAERVAAERDESIGDSVGYNVRFKREAPREVGGSIEFVTTGILLRRLMSDPSLSGISHVMIDEVHERDINTDFLLILLRDLLTKRPDLRVILMSATLDAESFGTYFSRGQSNTVPVLSVPTQPRHPVAITYLEDLASGAENTFQQALQSLAGELLAHNDNKLRAELEEALEEAGAAKQLEALSHAEDEGETLESDSDSEIEADDDSTVMVRRRVETLQKAVSMRGGVEETRNGSRLSTKLGNDFDSGDAIVNLTVQLAQHLTRAETDAGRSGSILCFLPGWDEIKLATTILEEKTNLELKRKMKILPLHSTIPQEDQQRVFEPADEGTTKVILATNIAESSVTIDDVLAVVDSGLVREMNFDSESAMSKMETPQISRSSATQRLGRAGRVAPGTCYRLYSRGDFEAMSERPAPEIQRTALEATCLQTCNMTSTGVENFLRRALDPPAEEAVSFAMNRLIKLGAISRTGHREGGEALTPLGRILSRLPLDPEIGRMLVMGVVMNCLSPCLTAAACFSSRNIFNSPIGLREEARETRRAFSETSDVLGRINAYDEFWEIVSSHPGGWKEAKDWAFENFVSIGAMVSIRAVRLQLLQELNKIGLVPNDDLERVGRRNKRDLRPEAAINRNADNELLFSAVLATGFPGNLAARRKIGSFGTLRTRTENHAGLHPSSVGFHRRPPKGSGVKLPSWYLYREMVLSSQIFLRDCSPMTPEQIILFGGYPVSNSMTVRPPSFADHSDSSKSRSGVRGILEDWIVVEGYSDESVDLLLSARETINAAVEYKVMHPKQPVLEEFQEVIDAVVDLYDILEESSEYTSSAAARSKPSTGSDFSLTE